MSDDLSVIYLTPHCDKCRSIIEREGDGILWCADPQEPCEECGKEWIAYDRRDTAAKEPTP